MTGNKNLLLKPIARPLTVLKAHRKVQGVPEKLFFLCGPHNLKKAGVLINARRIDNAKLCKPHVEKHRHLCDKYYVFLGSGKDFTGLKVEVFLGKGKYTITSPACVFVPKGTIHAHRSLKGSGVFMGVLLSKGKSYNQITEQA